MGFVQKLWHVQYTNSYIFLKQNNATVCIYVNLHFKMLTRKCIKCFTVSTEQILQRAQINTIQIFIYKYVCMYVSMFVRLIIELFYMYYTQLQRIKRLQLEAGFRVSGRSLLHSAAFVWVAQV